MTTIFDAWFARDVGQVFVQLFDVTLARFLGHERLCVCEETCADALALEHDGDVRNCDHYVEPAHRCCSLHHCLPCLTTCRRNGARSPRS